MQKEMDREQLLKEAAAAREILRRKAAEGDVWSFLLYMDTPFFSRRPFLKKIACAFQRLHDKYADGKVWKLAVSMPPRAGKSYTTTLFITFMIGRFPRESVMRNCCTATLYDTFSRATLRIMKSDKFAKVFPKVKLREGYQNIGGWAVEDAIMSSYFGAGVGGSVIGHGATMLAITDDLYRSLEDAMSETINNSIISWKSAVHDSRLSYKTCVLDIGTRWRKCDVLGILEEQGKYDEIVRIPALDENDRSFCEEVKTTEQYLEMRETLDRVIWAAEYQQSPVDSVGLLYDRPFRTYDGNPPDATYMKTYMICDPSDTGKDSLCTLVIADRPDGCYVRDILHTQDNADITIPKVAEMCKIWSVDECFIEKNSMGRIFMVDVERISRISKNYKTQFTAFHTKLNKDVRIFTRAVEVNNLLIFPHDWANRWPSFYREVTNRSREGGETHDDAPDACTMAIEHRPYNNFDINWSALKNKLI